MLPTCDGCGAPFTVTRALDCRIGDLVGRRDNEIRNSFGNLASLVWSQVCKKPVVRESQTANDRGALVADLYVRGV